MGNLSCLMNLKCVLSLATLSWFGLKFVCTSPDLLAGRPVFALTHFAAQNSSTRGPSCFSGQVVSATEVHRKPSAGNSSSTSLTVDGSMTVSRAENTRKQEHTGNMATPNLKKNKTLKFMWIFG